MASTNKKGSKSKKPILRRPKMKTSVAEQARANAELRQQLAESLQREKAAAIINGQLLQERDTRNRELGALYEVASSASQSLELKPVLDAVVQKITDIFNFDATGIYLLDSDNETLNLMASTGSGENGLGGLRVYRPGQGIIGKVAATGHAMVFENIDIDPRYQELSYSKGTKTAGFTFFAIFPITAKLRFVGTILLLGKEPRKLSHDEIQLITSMSEQIGIAVENMRLFEEVKNKTIELERSNTELRETLEQQTATTEILAVIASSPTDVQPVLDVVAESAARLCDANNAAIMRVFGKCFQMVAYWGDVPESSRSNPISHSITRGSPVGKAILDRQIVHVDDLLAQVDTEYPDARNMQTVNSTRTVLAAPLLLHGVSIGAVLVRRREVRSFTDKQIVLLKTFADQAVIAIENVRLFNETKESLEQQTATSEILGVIASSPTDIQPVLDVVAENAARVCGADDAVIRLVEGNVLRRVAHHGSIPLSLAPEIPIDRETVTGQAFVDRQVTHVDQANPRGGISTSLIVPLMREGLPTGTIHIRRMKVQPFVDKQISLLKTFADQAVIAIENVRLFKELQERNSELREALEHQTATSEVLSIISRSPTDVQPVLDAIVESAAKVCGIDDVVLRLREGNTMVARAHFGSIVIANPQTGIEGPLHRRMREHGTLHIADIHLHNDFPMLIPSAVRSWRAYLGVPLRQQGELIGTLVARRTEVRPFTPAQIKLLETLLIRR